MILIKLRCCCGQKYAFDVEPTGGRVGQAVQCPVCGADGTQAANDFLGQQLAAAAVSSLRVAPRTAQDLVPGPPPPLARPTGDSRRSLAGKRNWLWVALGGTLLCLLLLTGAATVRRGQHRELAQAATPVELGEGWTRTLAELNEHYAEPATGQNAATFYLQGFAALHLPGPSGSPLPFLGKGQLPPLGFRLPPTMRAAMAGLLRSNQEALQDFEQAAMYEHCRYPVDLTLGYDALFPHYPKLDRAVGLVGLAAIWHAEMEQAEQAANDVGSGLALARSLAEEPSLLSQLLRAASVATAVAGLEQTVNRAALPDRSLAKLFQALQAMEEVEARGEPFSRALAAEAAMANAMLAAPQQLSRVLLGPGSKLSVPQRHQVEARLRQGAEMKEEQEFLVSALRQLLDARKEPFPGRLQSDALVQKLVSQGEERKLVVLPALLPGLGRRASAEAECLARLRLGGTAVALDQFRNAHDRQYPLALAQLMPAYLKTAPIDPFDGQPLRYQKKGQGYVLYSIGPDLKDDAGERKRGREGDLVFTVAQPGMMPRERALPSGAAP